MGISPFLNHQPLTPLNFLRRASDVFANRTAVIYGDRRYNWREFTQRTDCLANALKNAGIHPGDKVAFLCRNLPPLLEAHYGIPKAGAVLVALNTRFSTEELAYIINHSEAKALFVDENLASNVSVRDVLQVKTFVSISEGEISKPPLGIDYEDFLKTGSDGNTGYGLIDENEPLAINYTSGTTGVPKGCVYTHRSAYLQSLAQALETGLGTSSVLLWTLPMFHCNGWCRTWAVACQGSASVCLTRPDPEKIFKLIEQDDVTHMCGAPIVWARLGDFMDQKGLKFPRRVKIEFGGATPPLQVIRSMERKGGEVIHGYGLTESLDGLTVCEWQPEWDVLSLDEQIRIKSRQGVVNVAASEMRVVDENMQDVCCDGVTVGEIIIRGNILLKEYYKQPEETMKAFRGGWFHTGDGAVIHPDGYMEIKDRFKDIIISGGENIASIEVENVLSEHPDVSEAACFAIKDDEWGEKVKALVTLIPGRSTDAANIIEFCRKRLAHFKCPKVVEFGEIPRSSTGKVLKDVLRKREQGNNPEEGK